jgi:predicted nucleic acid-binding protein
MTLLALPVGSRVFLDTAPIIYYVEGHPHYLSEVRPIFDRIIEGSLIAVTSPITLAECLIAPHRLGLAQLEQDFYDLIVEGRNTLFMTIDDVDARRAGELRARYNLTLPDAFQIAVALNAGCNAFLTNDAALRRVTEMNIIILSDNSP